MRALLLTILVAACTGTPGVVEPTPPDAQPDAKPITKEQAGQIAVERAWVRAVPPGSKNTALFATLTNRGPTAITLTGARSSAAQAVELHTHTEEDGQMKMRRVESMAVEGNGHHHLAQGGDHVMLIGLTRDLAEGGQVTVSLTFSDGSSLDVQAPVRRAAPDAEHGHGHGHGHGDGAHGHGG